MPDMRSKALGYLRDRKVCLQHASTPAGSLRPYEVLALVQGHNARHAVRFSEGAWSCTCGRGECAHVCAVQMVTGWPSAADRPARAGKRRAA